ncbi:hypothetical protein BKA66DRAFT_572187 [Pyrenochaeta sp. MPI-SDFR-AT-0127]|nr:hypothetical protein BKA66DRAFT_572187 [Pyrenochaeta sp. MPI-SDFR-AT-0127]
MSYLNDLTALYRHQPSKFMTHQHSSSLLPILQANLKSERGEILMSETKLVLKRRQIIYSPIVRFSEGTNDINEERSLELPEMCAINKIGEGIEVKDQCKGYEESSTAHDSVTTAEWFSSTEREPRREGDSAHSLRRRRESLTQIVTSSQREEDQHEYIRHGHRQLGLASALVVSSSSNPLPSQTPDFKILLHSDHQATLSKEIEPFPNFTDTWDAGIPDEIKQHCALHCNHPICRLNRQQVKDIEGKSSKCECFKAAVLSTAERVTSSAILRVTGSDIESARRLYQGMDGNHVITIDLQSTITILGELVNLGALDFKFHLIGCKKYTPSTVFDASDYIKAAGSASSFINKLSMYFKTSLRCLPGERRRIAVQELEKEIQGCMRIEVLWWMSRWCLPKHLKMNNRFAIAIRTVNMSEHNDGVQAVLERMSEIVKEVVGVLACWDVEQYEKRGVVVTDCS